MNCQWCQKKEAEFRIQVYHLEKITRSVANNRDDVTHYTNSDLYASIILCQTCLPIVKERDSMMGRTKKRESKNV